MSAGNISVAICPGGVRAAAIAAAPSAATDLASGEVLTQRENGFAAVSMSVVKRRVVAPVIGRMVADDVDHRRRGLVGVVDVGEPVGHARARDAARSPPVVGHPGIAVGGPGDHPLEEAEHAAHAVDPVERGDKMHLRGAGIGKAHIDAAADQRAHQAFRAVHRPSPNSVSSRSMPAAARRFKAAGRRSPHQAVAEPRRASGFAAE